MQRKNIWLPLGMVTAAILLNITIWTYAASEDSAPLSFQNQKETILTVKTTSGETYGFYGELKVIRNGVDGGQPELELEGWLVGYDEDTDHDEIQKEDGEYE
ncbi:hypothetical protein [Enterocloster bolteae]|uniref:hypothetical protein n=1 Tax=Enterocloster bolteae TaxID=208479 RepID=UPI0028DCC2AC|nr:hypothetical protein [Enterocloster bolteae]